MASAQRAEAIRRSTTRLTNGSAWKASAATFGGMTNQRNRPAALIVIGVLTWLLVGRHRRRTRPPAGGGR
jgi:hypothetical protein